MGGPHREDNEGVGYVANESGAQIIRDMAHLKKSNCTMNENIMELLSWKADVDSSLKTFEDIFTIWPEDSLKIHRKLLRCIK